MAIGATTGSRSGGSRQSGGHPAQARPPGGPDHPESGLPGVGSQAPAGAAARGDGPSRAASGAVGARAPAYSGSPERPAAGWPIEASVMIIARARPRREGKPGRARLAPEVGGGADSG